MNDRIFLALSCCLVAACSAGADAHDPAASDEPAAAVAAQERPAPELAARHRTPIDTGRSCSAPDGYAEVPIAYLLDDPAAYEGALVATAGPTRDASGGRDRVLIGPAGSLGGDDTLRLREAGGSSRSDGSPLAVWGELARVEGHLTLEVHGFCHDPIVPCGLYAPDCPSGMTCTLYDCSWNGGNCGINPQGSCSFDAIIPCGLYTPDCPSGMTCVLDDCSWNGGNCGINPPGRCFDAGP